MENKQGTDFFDVPRRQIADFKAPKLPGCAGAGGPRGATPHSRSGGVVVRRYPSSKVRSSHEEIPHAQGKKNPSKMIGVARGHQRADTMKP